tara:strand:+ start:1958 stop:2422 length:465 start_codon:yes stop_codon:yes gene_type:complete
MKNVLIQDFEKDQATKINEARDTKSFPKFSVGDTVSVKYKITEGSTTRLQAFQGVVISKTKSDDNFNATFTVRKISSGIGVERRFVVKSPLLSSIEVLKRGVVRRAKLYYLRELTGKASRIREKLDFSNSKESTKTEAVAKKEEKPAAASEDQK